MWMNPNIHAHIDAGYQYQGNIIIYNIYNTLISLSLSWHTTAVHSNLIKCIIGDTVYEMIPFLSFPVTKFMHK